MVVACLMTTLVPLLSLIVTAIYAYFTYRILSANQHTVAAMREQTEQERRFRIREYFLAGIAAIAQYDIASTGVRAGDAPARLLFLTGLGV